MFKNKKIQVKRLGFHGGDGEDRTLDLLNAIQALSQYTQKRTLTSKKLFYLINTS